MPESTLNLALTDLSAEAGTFLGWGRDASAWDARKAAEVKALVGSALRKFYFQAQADPRDANHNWTFMKPVAQLTLPQGTPSGQPPTTLPYIDLPDDFGGFEGEVTVSRDGLSGGFWPLKLVSEEMIRVKYAAFPSISGRPVAAAEWQVRGTAADRSNRSRLVVYPVPDADYTLMVPYYILPDFLTTANPYPYGGAAHAETMKAAVRAAAELYLDGSPGPEAANYQQCLAASVQYDRRHQPKSLGINSDMSDFLNQRKFGNWPNGLWHPLGIGFLGEAHYT